MLESQLVAPKRGRTTDLPPPLSLLLLCLQTVDVVVLHTYLIRFRGVSSEPGKRSFQEETPSPMLSLTYFAENTVCFRERVFMANPVNLRLDWKH